MFNVFNMFGSFKNLLEPTDDTTPPDEELDSRMDQVLEDTVDALTDAIDPTKGF